VNRTDRLTGLILALHGGKRTAADLAARFEVSRRTILRDVAALSEVGVPVVALPGPGGGFALAEGYRLPPLHFSAAEATALLLALRALGDTADAPFGDAPRSAGEKLRAALRPDVLAAADRELGTLGVARSSPEPAADLVTSLRAAIRDGAWLRIGYRSLRRDGDRTVLPRRLVSQDGRWYCYAVCLEAGEERSYRVDRIETATPIPVPPGADAALASAAAPRRAYDHPDHPEILVRLTAQGARLAEAFVHPGAAPRALADGAWELRVRCPPAELAYYAREIHALGPAAEAIAPPEFRAMVAALARATADRYDGRTDW